MDEGHYLLFYIYKLFYVLLYFDALGASFVFISFLYIFVGSILYIDTFLLLLMYFKFCTTFYLF